MLWTYSQADVQKMLFNVWSYLRVVTIIIHNLYVIPIYLFINWTLLVPLYYLNIHKYMIVENYLYNWCLYVVSSWSYGAGLAIHEFGDDLYRLKEEKSRLLVIANHQSTADVPLIMQSFTSRSQRILLWIMDVAFKWTNFGVVSITHGDYFLNTKSYQTGDIYRHTITKYSQFKDLIILFPEGGFRYKRLNSSNKYAEKHNYPLLSHVTYPRFGAYSELMESDVGVTHVVDLTIGYEDLQNPQTILDIARGHKKSYVLFNYRIFDIRKNPEIRTEQWLNQIWREKEELLFKYYTDKQSVLQTLQKFNIVTLSWIKIIAIHGFYLSFWLAFYVLYKATKYYMF
ncbi:acyl-CoA:lysophosphatidylglycerol acyltransferase 1-like [Oppia nitens]|uniref:acyl-CoA:lysophosphatidylglycerol acyltransferase 1-like n=1 Tax=Oppia nitens TaxID=1686743 RepID=UPI0023DCB05C|nr:acyl-CoA:lysophosphatidylglycerol acyltransferase 1-like [Oppia nitens]XP_054164545.1 acyl-CoA:lysophosphatidylglycerol acyltransferase 1-like [Oppia nitens]XP_054164546.1 acyl-CoA:lysophosphatidylglycerol acyltransferase 1-like [Oppia nitens]XP_054164547.1 acyl-CoA:lysophosphatidylglycerol acyltransferase 1-like [Oppia nitens]